MKLYHYTTIEAFAKIWVSKQLKFSESKNTNDLFEKRKTWEFVRGILPAGEKADLTEAFKIFGNAFSEILAQYKQISFTKDYKNESGFKSSMMWGQYAHNENGVCIEFDSEKMLFPPNTYRSKVKYTYKIPVIRFDKQEIIDKEFMQRFVKQNRKLLFFTKHKHWEHENEYRVISSERDYLLIDGAITKIYVYDSVNINTNVVEHIVNNEVPIKFLYISHLHGDRYVGCDDLEAQRLLEKRLKDEPDYYTNKEKVRKRFEEIVKEFGLPIKIK